MKNFSFPLTKRATFFSLTALALLTCFPAKAANQGVPMDEFISRGDHSSLEKQAGALYQKLDSVAVSTAESVVYVRINDRIIAMGTVVAPGKVLTKLSDLLVRRGALIVQDAQGKIFDARVVSGNKDHDVALLDVPSLRAKPLDFSQSRKAAEGDFLLTVLPNGKAGDFGVVSVEARSLRESDLPFVGVVPDLRYQGKGTLVADIQPQSGAHAAGLQSGDLILELDKRPIDTPLSMRTALQGKNPGDKVELKVQRGEEVYQCSLVLSNRPEMTQFSGERLEAMNAVGNPMNLRRSQFPFVIQSDMTMPPYHAGAPVLGIDGKLVGLALSRAGRIETYILPASLIAEGLSQGLAEASSEMKKQAVSEAGYDGDDSNRKKKRDQASEKLEKQLRAMQREIRGAEIVEE